MCSFPHFSLTCFEISWNFAHVFVLMYYRSSSSVVTLHPSGSPSVHHFSDLASYMHWQLSWNFKFDFGFAFLFEKRYIKKSLLKCSWRAYNVCGAQVYLRKSWDHRDAKNYFLMLIDQIWCITKINFREGMQVGGIMSFTVLQTFYSWGLYVSH